MGNRLELKKCSFPTTSFERNDLSHGVQAQGSSQRDPLSRVNGMQSDGTFTDLGGDQPADVGQSESRSERPRSRVGGAKKTGGDPPNPRIHVDGDGAAPYGNNDLAGGDARYAYAYSQTWE